MNRFMRVIAPVAGAALFASTALAGGETPVGFNVDLDFQFFQDAPSDSFIAASGQAGHWDIVVHELPGDELLTDTNGNLTNVVVSKQSNEIVQSNCVGGVSTLDYRSLMCDYAWEAAGVVNNIEYTVSNLPPGTYQIYTYAVVPGSNNPQNNTIVNINAGGTNFGNEFISGNDVATQTFQEGLTHTIHTFTVDAGDDVVLTVFDGSGEFGDPIALNGFQIIPTGEAVAEITAPDFLSCGCQPVQINGTALAEGAATVASWKLEWSLTGNDPWNPITTGNADVINGFLANWDTDDLPEGHYVIRLTVLNASGHSSTAFTTVYLDRDFDPLQLSGPQTGSVYGGTVCIGGTFWDNCFDNFTAEYRLNQGGSQYMPVDPGQPVYTQSIINQTGAVWDTPALGIADGEYIIRVIGETGCGNTDDGLATIIVDNTPPTVEITEPIACSSSGCESIDVFATIDDPHLESWVLQYTGGGQNNWVTIASGSQGVQDGLIGTLDTSGLDPCCYTLRIVATDSAIVNCNGAINQSTQRTVSVKVGLEGDLNGDNAVDSQDLNILLGDFGLTCP